ncbi:MAG: hypothetical protein GYB65_21405, partial [Chloroflexi bacterium]|nr:hypothetical protein [Chloroflexota bacterium]
MDQPIRRIWNSEGWSSVLLIILAALLAYGVLVPWQGLRWDDWFWGWTAEVQGADSLIDRLSEDRPGQGVLLAATYSVFGNQLLAWHGYVLVVRIAAALAFLWALRGLWPEQRMATTTMAVLFVVYPGFLQQNILVYHGHFTALILFGLSLGMMLRALKSSRRSHAIALTTVAAVLTALYMLIIEHFVGLEILRLAFLWA